MNVAQNVCGCNSAIGKTAGLSEPCSCGCCGSPASTKEERIAELRSLRASVDQELAELEDA